MNVYADQPVLETLKATTGTARQRQTAAATLVAQAAGSA
jgi:hypothetical protein